MVCHFPTPMSNAIKQYSWNYVLLITVCYKRQEHIQIFFHCNAHNSPAQSPVYIKISSWPEFFRNMKEQFFNLKLFKLESQRPFYIILCLIKAILRWQILDPMLFPFKFFLYHNLLISVYNFKKQGYLSYSVNILSKLWTLFKIKPILVSSIRPQNS